MREYAETFVVTELEIERLGGSLDKLHDLVGERADLAKLRMFKKLKELQ